MPEEPEMAPYCEDVGAFEECPAKPDVEEAPTVPVPPVQNSSLAKRIKEERIKNEQQQPYPPIQPFIVVKRLHDPLEEGDGKDKPLVVRRKTRKRAFDECSSTDGESVSTVIVPVAAIWVKQSHYPHLLSKELQLQKKGQVLPGGERFLLETLAAMKKIDKGGQDQNKDGFEDSTEDVDDVDDDLDMPYEDLVKGALDGESGGSAVPLSLTNAWGELQAIDIDIPDELTINAFARADDDVVVYEEVTDEAIIESVREADDTEDQEETLAEKLNPRVVLDALDILTLLLRRT
ncbi:hypothetical protein HPB51_014294 [Rhipicephalus microplus]|uniref:Uncharacterized protein n=1 Tax=Rhipicephalus microplus TaxID=6941 RepID=A0A9J6DVL6_RHIMP|nr:hypothetical protein HPB51_014294 [Rhipicephalus microplus]